MKLNALRAGCALMGLWSVQAIGQSADEDARIFGTRPAVLDISLAPSGQKIAFSAPSDRNHEKVVIIDVATGKLTPVLAIREDGAELRRCDWASDETLVCSVTTVTDDAGTLVGFDRLFAVDATNGATRMLSGERSSAALGIMQDGGEIVALDPPGEPGKILMTRQFVPEFTTASRTRSDAEGLGVELVDVKTAKRSLTEKPDRDAVKYIADEAGRVRMKVRHITDSNGRLTGKRTYAYRPAEGGQWITLSRTDEFSDSDQAFYPVAVEASSNTAIGFKQRNGFDALYRLALNEGAQPELLLGRDDVDVDTLLRVGRDRRVVGASYATEKRQVAYFDKELQTLADNLRAALPTKPLIDIVDASADGSKLLMIASSDTDPGMVYLYDKGTRRLEEVLPLRLGLDGRKMGEMRPVSFPASDGTVIPGYLTLPPGSDGKGLKAIVMPHGGPSARDEWGFDWLVQYFAAKGYAVLQPNYRGSTGYGSAWFGRNGFQAWRTAIGDVNDAGRWMVSQGIAKPEQLAIVGWSYGGYAALQSQVLDANLFKAVVAIAPVTDLELMRSDALKYTNSALVRRFVGEGPHVSEGSPARNAQAFSAPVLMFHGDRDENVGINQARTMSRKLKDAGKSVELIEYAGLAHGLDDSVSRAEMLTRIQAFLDRSLAR